MIDNLEEKLHIPLCEPQRVPVKMIVRQLQATSQEKRLLETHIASIQVISVLNEQTIKVRHYKDDDYSFYAIYVLKVLLKKQDSINAVASLLHSAFPESTLLLLNYQSSWYVSAAEKRINKNDSNKSVVEDVVTADIKEAGIPKLDLSAIKAGDLREYNQSVVSLVYKLKVMNATGVYPTVQADYKAMMKKYDSLMAAKNQLEDEYKQVTMMAEKMKIDNAIYDIENKISKLLKSIEGR